MYDEETTRVREALGDLASALAPFGSSTTLPRAAYVDPDVFVWEQREFFEAGWICVGRADMVAVGESIAIAVGATSAIAVRDHDGALNVFANICRHRGHELLGCGESAAAGNLRCPYHGWTYTLDGALRTAPRMADVANFAPGQLGLVRLAHSTWGGWLWINSAGAMPSLEESLADLDLVVAPYRLDTLVLAARSESVVAANWKLIHENYHECYHCPNIHPELCRVSPWRSGVFYPGGGEHWTGGTMDLADGATTMSIDGTSPSGPTEAVLEAGVEREVGYIAMMPNLLLTLQPDYVMTHRLTPISCGATHVECAWLVPRSTIGEELPDLDSAVAFWGATNAQDFAAVESLQRSVQSPHWKPGIFSDLEESAQRFTRAIATRYQKLTD